MLDSQTAQQTHAIHRWAYSVLLGSFCVLLICLALFESRVGQQDAPTPVLAMMRQVIERGSNQAAVSKSRAMAMVGSFAISVTSVLALSPQTVLWLTTTLCLVVLLAYATNPSDASLKSHLNHVVARKHFEQTRQQSTVSSQSWSDDAGNAAENASFTHRVSLSLRTTSYHRLDFGIFGIAHAPSIIYSAPRQPTRFIGAFGKWWACGTATSTVLVRLLGDADEENTSIQQPGVLSVQPHDPVQAPAPHTQILDRRRKSAERGVDHQRGASATNENSAQQQADREDSPSRAAAGSSNGQNAESIRGANVTVGMSTSVEDSANSQGEAALREAEAQLEQIRTTSEATRRTLQTQLDELRSRKRDEDAARLDVKTRMKTLDEHKRHAEGTRREAERRLKAATGAQDLLKNRIATHEQQMRDLQSKLTAKEKKVEISSAQKANRRDSLTQQIKAQEDEGEKIAKEMGEVQTRIELLKQRILNEEGNLQAASEMAAERFAQEEIAASQAHLRSEQFAPQDMYDFTSPQPQPAYGAMYGGMTGLTQPAVASQGYTGSSMWAEVEPQMGESLVQPQAVQMRTLPADEEDEEAAFDPTVQPTRLSRRRPPSLRFSPFSFEGHQDSVPAIEDPRALPGQTMTTPATADLLPSNLFQSTDDDEAQAGSLTSDDSVLDKLASQFNARPDLNAELEDTSSPRKASSELPASESAGKTTRSWWGGRPKSKAGSSIISAESDGQNKGQSEAGFEASATNDTSGPTTGKRRSLSIFPKVSLNPSAKSFRGPMKRIEQESSTPARASFDAAPSASKDDEVLKEGWNASLSSLPSTRQDYEAMRRAFERGENDSFQNSDERRDTWTSPEVRGWPRLFGPRGSHLSALQQGSRSSSDSNTHKLNTTQQGLGAPSASQWLDDIILPLERTSSWGSHRSAEALPATAPRPSKPSRFALFSGFNGKSSVAEGAAADASKVENGEEAPVSAPPASESTTAVPTSARSKRASFLWTRKASEAALPTVPPERTPSRERDPTPP